jgi:hypothetical protein
MNDKQARKPLRQDRKMGIGRAIVVAAAAAYVGGPAGAAIDCVGTVTNLSLQLSSAGTVTLSLSGGPSWTYLCDLSAGGRNGVPADVCKVMYATLVTAKATGKQVLIRFNDYDSCAAVPAWGNAGSLGWTRVMLD